MTKYKELILNKSLYKYESSREVLINKEIQIFEENKFNIKSISISENTSQYIYGITYELAGN